MTEGNNMKRAENNDFIVEKPSKNYFRQMNNVNINREKSSNLFFLFLHTYCPSLIMRKISDKFQMRDSLQNTSSIWFKTVNVIKMKKKIQVQEKT